MENNQIFTNSNFLKDQIITTLPYGFVYQDITGKILYSNLTAKKILGLSDTQITGRDSNHPEWMPIHEDGSPFPGEEHPSSIALKTGKPISNIVMGVFNSLLQKYIWILVHSSPVFQNSKEIPFGVYTIFEDITESKKNRDYEKDLFSKLRKSNLEVTQRQFAIDQHAIVAITDAKGTIIYANSRFCAISKYSREELIGKNHRILNSGYHSKFFFHNMYSTINSGDTWHGEIRNKTKDGNYYWVATTIAPLKNLDGKIEQFISIRTDITKRVEAEEALRISEARTRTILDNSRDSIIFIDTEGKIQFFNNIANIRLNQIFKFDLEIGKWMQDSIPDDRKKDFRENFQKAMNGEIITRIKNIQTTNKSYWFDIQYTPINNKSNEIIGVMFTAKDITEKKETELEKEIYLKDLESLNHTKDKFFNIIAHDLRNPFTGILGISEMLETKLSADNNDYSRENLLKMTHLIQSSARSAFNLLENLMNWARSQTGELKYNPMITSANAIIEATIPIVSGLAFNKNIQIEKYLESENFVLADPEITNTILRNLITNSIKFTKTGGEIKVSSQFNKQVAIISVEDNGIGIKEENISKLFRIDSKFSNMGTNGEKGTGLGLILCKEFVEKQGGEIWVESEFGKGTKFSFTLPLAS